METELIQRLQGGDVGAFEELMNMHIYQLRAFIALRAPVPHLIDEVVHDTFVFAYKNIDKFAANTNFKAWLRTIAHTKLRREVQKFARDDNNKKKYLEVKLIQSAQKLFPRKEDPRLETLDSCLENLSPILQQLLALKYKDGLSTQEMAETLNKSMAWVRTNLCRTRSSLKKCLEQQSVTV